VDAPAIPLEEPTVLSASLESPEPPFTPWFHLEWVPGADLDFTVGCCIKPNNPIAETNANAFTPELWRHDVGELFIKHATSEAYLEINLAPFGAWWASLFSSYRDPVIEATKAPFTPVSLGTKTLENTWETSLTVPQTFLRESLDFDADSRANVCFILGDSAQRHHFSYAQLPHDPPDYHHVSDFVSMK
jgi:hypothetical protein